MIRIAITAEAFEAKGERLIWQDRAVVYRLRAMRGPGESYSDVIVRLAAEGACAP
jgi:hypothetical protein